MNKKVSILLISIFGLLHSCTPSKAKEDYVILKQFDRIEEKAIATFSYVKNNSSTSYLLELSEGNKTLLKNTATGRTEEEYAAIPGYPGSSCAKQEQLQWQYFRTQIFPGLVARANSTCTPLRYCVGIYCNGQPRVFYLLLISPTASNCIKLTDVAAEASRYHF